MEYSQKKISDKNQYITGAYAIRILGLSRHSFEKWYERDLLLN